MVLSKNQIQEHLQVVSQVFVDGSTLKFGANFSAAPDFILYQESGGIGEPSDTLLARQN